MSRTGNFFVKLRVVVMYIVAVALLFLVPLTFMSLGSSLVEKIGRKIPIKEGTFSSNTGDLSTSRPAR